MIHRSPSSAISRRCRATTISCPCRRAGRWREAVNSDADIYGGSGLGNLGAVHAGNQPSHGQPASARVSLPPMATLFLVHEG